MQSLVPELQRLRQDVLDALSFLSAQPSCRLTHTSVQTFTGTQYLAFDTQRFSIGGMHDTSTNNSRITVVKRPGRYIFWANLEIDHDSAPGAVDRMQFRKSGSTIVARKNISTFESLIVIEDMALDDYMELGVINDNGANNLNVQVNAQYSPEFAAFRVDERTIL